MSVGNHTVTANYSGDSGYSSSADNIIVVVSAAPPPSFSISGPNVTVMRGATTGNTSTITVTPSGSFTGSVALTAQVTGSPAGAQYAPTFSFGATSPISITDTNPKTATLTIGTTAATTAALALPARPGLRWLPVGGATLAGLLLLFVPTRRRNWRALLGMVALLALFASLSACGGGVSSSTSIAGTTQGAYTIIITGSSGTTSASKTITLTVQ